MKQSEFPQISIIVPAHNEETRIDAMLDSYAKEFADSEIIVVLNGCTDKTRGRVEFFQTRYSNIRMVDIPHAIGKGGAVRAGFFLARAPIVGYVDADGSTSAHEMRRLCQSLESNDGVIGSRWTRGSNVAVKQPFARRLASRCFNGLVRLLFGLKFSDTQCGAKVFRRSVIERVMLDVETSNLAFDVDLLLHLKTAGFSIVERPTVWVDSSGSQVRLLSASAKMLAALVRLRLQRSLLRLIVPIFDSFFPTLPMPVHSRLRILIMNWRDPKHPQAGGAETYLLELARWWKQWGHDVDWLTAGFKGAPARDEIDGIRIRRVGNALTVYMAVPFTYLREFRDRFDVIIDSENGIPFFSPLFSLKPKICVMHHVHREVFRKHLPPILAYPLMWVEEKFMPFVYRRSNFVAVSEDTRAEMKRLGMVKRRVGLVYNGVDPRLEPGSKAAKPLVVYVGRLKQYKRIHLLIEAFLEVLKAFPDAELRIAGVGDARNSLERLVASLGLQSNVFFEGFVDEPRKRELLQSAWVFVSPSEMEGWGIAVLEANACGTPAVSYAVPGLREAISHGVNGLVVPEGDSLSDAISSILADDSLRNSLVNGARDRASLFSWEGSALAMLGEIMQAMIGGEVRAIDLDGEWALVGSNLKERSSKAYAFSNHRAYEVMGSNPFISVERRKYAAINAATPSQKMPIDAESAPK